MSEAYEGVVFGATEDAARLVFAALATPLHFCLLRLTPEAWGLGRVASKGERFDTQGLEQVAAQVSHQVAVAASLSYDNSSGVRAAGIFRAGSLERRLGEEDEVWVPLDPLGHPMQDRPQLRAADLQADQEYECLLSAIDLALRAIGVMDVSGVRLKQAFCYGEAQCVAES